MKVSIIGGSGFVGTRLIDLIKDDFEVKNIDLQESSAFNELTVTGDVRDVEQMKAQLGGSELVVLLAAQHRDDVSPVSLYYDTNVGGMRSTLAAMEANGVKRLIFFSSVAVYGLNKDNPAETSLPDPFNHYGKSKFQAEQVLHEWYHSHPDWNIVVIRPTVIFGERNRGNVYNLIRQISSGRFCMVGKGDNTKSMAYVGNVVAFVRYAIDHFTEGYNVYNYIDKPDLTMNQLVPLVGKVLGKDIPSIHLPYWIGICGGYCFDVLAKITGKKLPVSSVRVKKFCAATQFDSSKAFASGFVPPYSLEEGLSRTLEFEFGNVNPVDDILLYLVRLAIGSDEGDFVKGFDSVVWEELYDAALKHSVASIAFDGLNILYQSHSELLDKDALDRFKFVWLSQTAASEQDYIKYKETVASLGRVYASEGIPMMLLKGYGLSLYWPVPEHRPTGDIDIYLFGKWREGDKVVSERFGIKANLSHHHHSVFRFEKRTVENHYDLIHTESHRSGRKIEARFKQLASSAGKEILPNIYEPSPDMNVLYVIRHTACHFAAGEMTLRQWLDCVLLVRALQEDADWSSFWNDVETMGMSDFVLALAYISDKYLDIDRSLFHIPRHLESSLDPSLSERVFQDILHPTFQGTEPSGSLRHLAWMLRRWWAHRWKHNMVYRDSLISTFFTQFSAHIVKPKG